MAKDRCEANPRSSRHRRRGTGRKDRGPAIGSSAVGQFVSWGSASYGVGRLLAIDRDRGVVECRSAPTTGGATQRRNALGSLRAVALENRSQVGGATRLVRSSVGSWGTSGCGGPYLMSLERHERGSGGISVSSP